MNLVLKSNSMGHLLICLLKACYHRGSTCPGKSSSSWNIVARWDAFPYCTAGKASWQLSLLLSSSIWCQMPPVHPEDAATVVLWPQNTDNTHVKECHCYLLKTPLGLCISTPLSTYHQSERLSKINTSWSLTLFVCVCGGGVFDFPRGKNSEGTGKFLQGKNVDFWFINGRSEWASARESIHYRFPDKKKQERLWTCSIKEAFNWKKN